MWSPNWRYEVDRRGGPVYVLGTPGRPHCTRNPYSEVTIKSPSLPTLPTPQVLRRPGQEQPRELGHDPCRRGGTDRHSSTTPTVSSWFGPKDDEGRGLFRVSDTFPPRRLHPGEGWWDGLPSSKKEGRPLAPGLATKGAHTEDSRTRDTLRGPGAFRFRSRATLGTTGPPKVYDGKSLPGRLVGPVMVRRHGLFRRRLDSQVGGVTRLPCRPPETTSRDSPGPTLDSGDGRPTHPRPPPCHRPSSAGRGSSLSSVFRTGLRHDPDTPRPRRRRPGATRTGDRQVGPVHPWRLVRKSERRSSELPRHGGTGELPRPRTYNLTETGRLTPVPTGYDPGVERGRSKSSTPETSTRPPRRRTS